MMEVPPSAVLKSIHVRFEATIVHMMDKLQSETKLRQALELQLQTMHMRLKESQEEVAQLSERLREVQERAEATGTKLKKALYEKEEVRQKSRDIMGDMLSKMKGEAELRKQCERELELLKLKLSLPQSKGANSSDDKTSSDAELFNIKESQITKLRGEVASAQREAAALREEADRLRRRNLEQGVCHRNLCRGFQAREDEMESRLGDKNLMVDALGRQKEHARQSLQAVAERLCELLVDLDEGTDPRRFLAPGPHDPPYHHLGPPPPGGGGGGGHGGDGGGQEEEGPPPLLGGGGGGGLAALDEAEGSSGDDEEGAGSGGGDPRPPPAGRGREAPRPHLPPLSPGSAHHGRFPPRTFGGGEVDGEGVDDRREGNAAHQHGDDGRQERNSVVGNNDDDVVEENIIDGEPQIRTPPPLPLRSGNVQQHQDTPYHPPGKLQIPFDERGNRELGGNEEEFTFSPGGMTTDESQQNSTTPHHLSWRSREQSFSSDDDEIIGPLIMRRRSSESSSASSGDNPDSKIQPM